MWNFYRYSFRLCKTQLMELFKASTIMTKLPQVFRILPWDNILGNRRSNPKKTIKLLLNKQKHQKLIIKGKFTNRRRKPLSNRRPFKSWLNFSEEALMHIALLCHKRLMHTFYSRFPSSAAFTFKKGAAYWEKAGRERLLFLASYWVVEGDWVMSRKTVS